MLYKAPSPMEWLNGNYCACYFDFALRQHPGAPTPGCQAIGPIPWLGGSLGYPYVCHPLPPQIWLTQ